MNTHRCPARFVFRLSFSRCLAAALVVGTTLISHFARAANGDAPAPSPALPSTSAERPAANPTDAPTSNAAPATALSPIVTEVLKMGAADVTTPVLKTYVECSPLAYQLTDSDVIALRKARVADEVVTVLLRRSAEIRAAYYSAKKANAARAAAPRPVPGGLDPESYEYFQHYYLHTRTLATASQNIPIYGYTGFSPAYGYASPYALGPPHWGRWGPAYRPGWYR